MTVESGPRAADPPRMLLVFNGVAPDAPIRPVEVAAVLSSLEEIFLVTLLRDAPPPDYREREWIWDYDAQSLHVRLAGLSLETPLRVTLAVPWHVYTVPFSAFAYGLAHVFGPPSESAEVFERAREDFWSSRLAGEHPKPEWMEWQAWLEYKHEQVQRTVPFRLATVDVGLALPAPEPEPLPAAEPEPEQPSS
jgi:hypothetical protein